MITTLKQVNTIPDITTGKTTAVAIREQRYSFLSFANLSAKKIVYGKKK
jgi:hypothetical protein